MNVGDVNADLNEATQNANKCVTDRIREEHSKAMDTAEQAARRAGVQTRRPEQGHGTVSSVRKAEQHAKRRAQEEAGDKLPLNKCHDLTWHAYSYKQDATQISRAQH